VEAQDRGFASKTVHPIESLGAWAKRGKDELLDAAKKIKDALSERLSKAVKAALPFRSMKEKALQQSFFNSRLSKVETPRFEPQPKIELFHRPIIREEPKPSRSRRM